MEYPPAWDYIPIGEMHTATFRGVDKAAGLTVYLEVTGQAAGAFRIALGAERSSKRELTAPPSLESRSKVRQYPKQLLSFLGSGSVIIPEHCPDPDLKNPVFIQTAKPMDSTTCKRFHRK